MIDTTRLAKQIAAVHAICSTRYFGLVAASGTTAAHFAVIRCEREIRALSNSPIADISAVLFPLNVSGQRVSKFVGKPQLAKRSHRIEFSSARASKVL